MMSFLSLIKCCLIFVFCLSLFTVPSVSTFISDAVVGSPFVSERRLLQVKQHCPVNFEFQNYTIITSQCQGPDYSPKLCCSAFKEFACPFADQLNDLRNDCSTIMFSYIKRSGNYPDGLFASLCRDGIDGLECPANPPSSSLLDQHNANTGSRIIRRVCLMIIFVALVQFI